MNQRRQKYQYMLPIPNMARETKAVPHQDTHPYDVIRCTTHQRTPAKLNW